MILTRSSVGRGESKIGLTCVPASRSTSSEVRKRSVGHARLTAAITNATEIAGAANHVDPRTIAIFAAASETRPSMRWTATVISSYHPRTFGPRAMRPRTIAPASATMATGNVTAVAGNGRGNDSGFDCVMVAGKNPSQKSDVHVTESLSGFAGLRNGGKGEGCLALPDGRA